MSGAAPMGNHNRRPTDWPHRAYELMDPGKWYTTGQVIGLLQAGRWSLRYLPNSVELSLLLRGSCLFESHYEVWKTPRTLGKFRPRKYVDQQTLKVWRKKGARIMGEI